MYFYHCHWYGLYVHHKCNGIVCPHVYVVIINKCNINIILSKYVMLSIQVKVKHVSETESQHNLEQPTVATLSMLMATSFTIQITK